MTEVSPPSEHPDPLEHSSNWRLAVGLLALVALVVGGIYVFATQRSENQLVAQVGESELFEDELFEILRSIESVESDDEVVAVDSADANRMISTWLLTEAVTQELASRDVVVPQGAIDAGTDELISRELDPATAANQLSIRFQAIGLTARSYGADNAVIDVAPPEYLCSSHLLVETEQEADAARERVLAGEDFAVVAADVSIDPSAQTNQGDLGCASTANFVPAFGAGARALGGPGLTGPVESSFGFHIIDVRSVGPLSAELHPEMDPLAIAAELQTAQATALSTAVDDAVTQLVADSQVRITDGFVDSRYGIWDPTRGLVPSTGVTP